MCSPPKPKKPAPPPTPPDTAAINEARTAAARVQAQRGLLSTNETGPLGLLTKAPTAPRTLLGG